MTQPSLIASPNGSYTLPKKFSEKCVLELTLSCRELKNMDFLSKTDACVVVYLEQIGATPKQGRWKEVGRTEVVFDNLNPEFSRKIHICYTPSERQRLKFCVYDVDNWSPKKRGNPPLHEQNFVGKINVMLSRLVEFSAFSVYEEKLFTKDDTKPRGLLIIAAEILQNRKDAYSMQFAGEHLPPPKAPFRTHEDYFFELRKNMNGRQLLVYRSEPISITFPTGSSTLKIWKSFQLTKFSLCSDDETKRLYLSLWKMKKNGSHKVIGMRETTLAKLMDDNNSRDDDCNLFAMSINGAALKMVHMAQEIHATFLDLVLHKGTFLHYFMAIDFSLANGQFSSPESLHYLDNSNRNAVTPYLEAIKAVLEVVQSQDDSIDLAIPVFGFGAEVAPDWEISHNFSLNGDPDNPLCFGVAEVEKAYKSALKEIRPQGPASFSTIIREIAYIANGYNNDQHYFVLLIFTSGYVSDLSETIDAIVAASILPLSIVIVGVGRGPFQLMIKLDADKHSLYDSSGRRQQRDIVQFVNYSEVAKKSAEDLGMGQIFLARELFYEAPSQFLSAKPLLGNNSPSKVRVRSASYTNEMDKREAELIHSLFVDKTRPHLGNTSL